MRQTTILILLLSICSLCQAQSDIYTKIDTVQSYGLFGIDEYYNHPLKFTILCNPTTHLYAVSIGKKYKWALYPWTWWEADKTKEEALIGSYCIQVSPYSRLEPPFIEERFVDGVLPGYEKTFKTQDEAQKLIDTIKIYIREEHFRVKAKEEQSRIKDSINKAQHTYKPCI